MHTSFVAKLVLSATVLTMAAQAHALVEAGHWQAQSYPSSPAGDNFTVRVDQTVGGDYTGVFLKYANSTLSGITYNVDEGADVFLVQPGSIFSNASIASQQTPFLHGVSVQSLLPTSTVAVGQEFYLGARTRSFSDPGFEAAAAEGTLSNFFTSFGWARFKVDASGVPQLIDSAMAFREGGIVVGTLQAVPEPSTWALMGVGLAALAWRTRPGRQTKV